MPDTRQFRVDYVFLASFSHYVDAPDEDTAVEIAEREFSPYSDDALASVEYSLRPVETDVEEA